jgi:hypothetical protein
MKRRRSSFNIYFALVCLVLAAGGCGTYRAVKQATSTKKELSTMRLYLEGHRADKMSAGNVQVTHNKLLFTIETDPFLDEADLTKASIVEDPDGTFSIQLQFNAHGTLLLDMYTASNKGKHIIVFSQFPKLGKHPKLKKKSGDTDDADLVDKSNAPPPPPGASRESAWLTAVLIRDRISSGLFRFTPDATREECNRIVRGLRNVIPSQQKLEKF